MKYSPMKSNSLVKKEKASMHEYFKTEIEKVRRKIIQQKKWEQKQNHMNDATVEASTPLKTNLPK